VSRATDAVALAARRGAPARRAVVRAVAAGTAAQLATVALVAGATGLLAWAAERPGLGAVAGLLVAVEVLAFCRAPLRHAERVTAHDLGLDGLAGWRTWLLEAVATWSPSRLAAARAGDALSRCLDDTDRLQDLWVRTLVPAASRTAALVVAAVLLAIAIPVAGAAVLGATALVAVTTWWRARRVCELGAAEAITRGAVAARAVEYAHGAESLRLLGADRAHAELTGLLVVRAGRLAAHREAVVAQLEVLAALLGAVAFVVAVGAVGLPAAQPALGAAVALGVLACGELLAGLPTSLDALGPVAGAAERLVELAEPPGTGTLDPPRGALVLDDVDVAPAADGPVLVAAVTLAAELARPVAVVGPTGSGKSSLLAVAAGLEAPRRGTVSLGGVALAELDEASLRRRVGWLPATPALLEGRVRDVLDVGRNLGDDALSAALEAVGLEPALRDRGGLDAVVGPRGDDLSGGERRRLALARLLAGRPDVYVLDEPTAGLDATAAARALDAVGTTGAAVLVASHDPRVVGWTPTRRVIADGRLA
jgi:ABC-type transport system involved in cytochrome bd biosynthesis fused ATPase/permease subunit